MKDDLMDRVTEAFEPSPMPIALKYIAYGKLAEVSFGNSIDHRAHTIHDTEKRLI
jgi:hypothetical protein